MNCNVPLAACLVFGFRAILDTLIVLRTLSKGTAFKLIRISSREEERLFAKDDLNADDFVTDV